MALKKQDPDPASKTTVGRYELIYPIASGGMATVYAARLSGMAGFERLFAIKVIHPHLAGERAFIEMFLDEARLAARIHHPNVAEIFEVGQDDGVYFMVGELVLGQDLQRIAQRAEERGISVPPVYYAHVISEACRGLEEAHNLTDDDGEPLNLVHRDVSTRNILISYKGYVKVIDFGIAWARGRLSQTDDGSAKGKIGYMPPEQLRGEAIDRRADIFAMGVVLYTLLVGEHPFPQESEGELVTKMLEGDFRPPREVNPALDETLEQIILKAMASDKDQRFTDATELGATLDRYVRAQNAGNGPSYLARTMKILFSDELEAHRGRLRTHRKTASPVEGDPTRESDPTDDTHSRITEVLDDGNGRAHPVSGSPPRQNAVLTIVIALTISGIIAGYFYLFPRSTQPVESPTLQPAPSTDEAPEPGAARLAARHPSALQAAPPSTPETVSITVEGWREDMTVTLDGKVTSPPLELPFSKTPKRLRISAPGFKAFETVLIPTNDKTIRLDLEPLTAAGSKKNKHRSPKRRKRKSRSGDKPAATPPSKELDGWESNPFQ